MNQLIPLNNSHVESFFHTMQDSIPSVIADKDLISISSTSKALRIVFMKEIERRAFEKINYFKATFYICQKLDLVLLDNASKAISEKIYSHVVNFEKNIPLSYFSSITLYDEAEAFTEKRFETLDEGKKTAGFCSLFREMHTDPKINHAYQEILEKRIQFAERILIDSSDPTLSIGNFSLFSIIQKQLNLQSHSAKFWENVGGSCDYFKQKLGCLNIDLLKSHEKNPTTEILLKKLEVQIGLLSELRAINLGCFTPDYMQIRQVFISALKGLSSLQNLKIVAIKFTHDITDQHITDISDFFEECLSVNKVALEKITVNCPDITCIQYQKLISNLIKCTKERDISSRILIGLELRYGNENYWEIAGMEHSFSQTPLVRVLSTKFTYRR